MGKLLITTIIMIFTSTLMHAQTIVPNLNDLSQNFIYAARADGETKAYVDTLAVMNESALFEQLNNDAQKKAFFINIYNGYVQLLLKKDPEKYKKRSAFFSNKQILLAGHNISLDDLEHGILRHSRIKWSLGYFGKIFPARFERKLRVDKIDYRIHFTLNCGAKSCPAIAYYKPEQINEQLDLATKTYLEGEANYVKENNTLYLPALMSWFRVDFGGKKKEVGLCKKLGLLPADVHPKVIYNKYNWSLYLKNYKS